MLKTKDSNQEPLALLYRNGQLAVSGQVEIPRFTDICLNKASQDRCEEAIEEAGKRDHPIQNDEQLKDYIDQHSIVDDLIKELDDLEKTDREGWLTIPAQITTAVLIRTKLIIVSGRYREHITKYRALQEEGRRRQEEMARAQAEEKRAEARYTDDPKRARQALVQAKKYEEIAKSFAPTPVKGLNTEEYAEFEIDNRTLAAKLPDELVRMDVDEREGNRRLRAMKQAGEKITPNVFPGLTITWKTRVRFHR